MNSYHQRHPDPEVRQKYHDWRNAMDSYEARSRGFATPLDMDRHNNSKETATFRSKLMAVANSAMRAVGFSKAQSNIKKQRRTGSKRGS